MDFPEADGACGAIPRMLCGLHFLNDTGGKHGIDIRCNTASQILAIPRQHKASKKSLVFAPSASGFR